MAKYAVLSDLHGNLQALRAVVRDIKSQEVKGVLLLGDIIDYGMQSNEVVTYLRDDLDYPIYCNLWGNHERAIMCSDFTHFSSQRGIDSAKRTASVLSGMTKNYLEQELVKEGFLEFNLEEKRCLAVHGSLEDPYWKAIYPGNLNGNYEQYDIVFSGHSHYSHVFQVFYDCNKPETRNKHAVWFINPGSVGQPRNHNACAQYVVLDPSTMAVNMRAVPYNVELAMSLFDDTVNPFYKERLKKGI